MGIDNLVSIIVPVYNVENYLDRCINSIVKQTYKSLEIILVDDGSTDCSGNICEQWKERDFRIKVYHKKNGGLSDARNYGMEKTNGEFICFVDSDDWLEQRFIEIMKSEMVNNEADIVECNFIRTSGDIDKNYTENYSNEIEIFCGNDCFFQFLQNKFLMVVWNKIYRRELLESFIPGVYHEDESWTYKIFSKVNKAVHLNYIGYYYYQRQGSIVNSPQSYKKIMDVFSAAKEKTEFIELNYPQYQSIGYSKMIYTSMYLFNQTINNDMKEKKNIKNVLIRYSRRMFYKYLRAKKYKKELFRFVLFNLFPTLYCHIYY